MEEFPKADQESVIVVVPVSPPAALGLGLCDVRKVFTNEQLKVLDHDLGQLAMQKRHAPPTDVYVD